MCRIIAEHLDVDEHVLRWQHMGRRHGRADLGNHWPPAGAEPGACRGTDREPSKVQVIGLAVDRRHGAALSVARDRFATSASATAA
jgi:hypothetical protein